MKERLGDLTEPGRRAEPGAVSLGHGCGWDHHDAVAAARLRSREATSANTHDGHTAEQGITSTSGRRPLKKNRRVAAPHELVSVQGLNLTRALMSGAHHGMALLRERAR